MYRKLPSPSEEIRNRIGKYTATEAGLQQFTPSKRSFRMKPIISVISIVAVCSSIVLLFHWDLSPSDLQLSLNAYEYLSHETEHSFGPIGFPDLLKNKSLGMNHFEAELGPQCGAWKQRYPKKERSTRLLVHYTANREWPEPGEGRGVIVLATTNLGRLKKYFTSWRTNFFPYQADTMSMLLLLTDNSLKNGTDEFVSMFPWIRKWDCEKDSTFCQHMHRLDEGYDVLFVPIEGKNPFMIYLGFRDFEKPFKTVRDGEEFDWAKRVPGCHGTFRYSYVLMTNWYANSMLQLEMLDYFDFFMKIDDDIKFLKPLDEDFINDRVVPKRSVLFHTMETFDHAVCAVNLNHAVSSFLSSESSLCQRSLVAVRNDDVFKDETSIYYSNFMGGWLGLFTSPEMLHFSNFWYNYEPGMWEHRWGDQQFWTKAVGLFHMKERVMSLEEYRNQYFKHK